jgi:hypothetical protein
MKRTKNKELNMVDVSRLSSVDRMKLHIHAHNSSISYSFMAGLSIPSLINHCHPTDREYYARIMYKEKRITAEEYRKCTRSKFNPNDDEETVIRIKGKD